MSSTASRSRRSQPAAGGGASGEGGAASMVGSLEHQDLLRARAAEQAPVGEAGDNRVAGERVRAHGVARVDDPVGRQDRAKLGDIVDAQAGQALVVEVVVFPAGVALDL